MDSAHPVPEQQLIEFVRKHGIQQGKMNERPYGPYDLALRIPDRGTFVTGTTFGWGFTTEEATASFFMRMIEDPAPDPGFRQWLGEDLFLELESRVKSIQEVNAMLDQMQETAKQTIEQLESDPVLEDLSTSDNLQDNQPN